MNHGWIRIVALFEDLILNARQLLLLHCETHIRFLLKDKCYY